MFARQRRALFSWLGFRLVLTADGAPRISAQQPPEPASAQPTALVVSATNAPLRVLGSDGLMHLEYDLLISKCLRCASDPYLGRGSLP